MKWFIYLFLCKMPYNKESCRRYYEKNKEQKKEKQKIYNTKKVVNKQVCICGKHIDFNNKQTISRHFDTIQHDAFSYHLKLIYSLRMNEGWTLKKIFKNKQKYLGKVSKGYLRKYIKEYI